MAGFLIAEEGPLAGLVIRFDTGNEWILGRDPDLSYQVLEDPMVSRKHVICRLVDGGYVLENLSAINPATVNGKIIETPTLLQEGDGVQIGNVFFLFTLKDPLKSRQERERHRTRTGSLTIYEESEELGALTFSQATKTRFMIKVISGPNTGAEFGLHEGMTLTLGKDPSHCDILFQDLSVSRQHAQIVVTRDGELTIEDLGSVNKVLVNGQVISHSTELKTQDLVTLGTTSFLVVDLQQTRETLISPVGGPFFQHAEEPPPVSVAPLDLEEEETVTQWKKMVIPTKHLLLAGLFALLIIVSIGSVLTLFKSKPISHPLHDPAREIASALTQFPEVEFSFSASTGKLFLLGHVMTEIDHQELLYLLRALPFVQSIENNVIIDELIWENTNALLMKNASWQGVNLTSLTPGHFVLRGYVQTLEEATNLSEYINSSFPYLDRLDNQVVVENTLEAQVQQLLSEYQFGNVTFQFSNGELILSGRVPSNQEASYETVVAALKQLPGVRVVKNFVLYSKPSSDVVDLSSQYKVTGSSKYGTVSQYVVINGKILSTGSSLDGMKITNMENNVIFLEKDGIKYKIQYNQP